MAEAVAAAANMFSVRIVTADYYMASPLPGLDICQSPLTQLPVKKVPVVRVFGATPAGKRERAGAGARASERAPGRRGCPPRRALARTPPALSGVAAEASLLSALLAFSPARDRRRKKKNVGSRERCAPSAAERRRAPGLCAASGRRASGLESLSRWVAWLRLVPRTSSRVLRGRSPVGDPAPSPRVPSAPF